MTTALLPNLPGLWAPLVHKACLHNEVASLAMRSLRATPEPTAPHLFAAEMKRIANRILSGREFEKWSLERTALSYEGSLRRRYLEAYDSLQSDPELSVEDWRLGIFVKSEKFGYDKLMKPRMIFPRSPRYNLLLASYLKPLEHWLWPHLTAEALSLPGCGRLCAKGLNPRERAELIKRKLDWFPEGVCFEVDGAAFEAHVGIESLQQEHGFYLRAYRGCRELASLLGKQLRNFGRSRLVEFSRVAGRASGDYNTGMGNTLVMVCAVLAALRSLDVPADILVDGDNALLFCSKRVLARLRLGFPAAVQANSGQEMVLERPVDRLESVVFGRSSPVCVSGVWRMVRPWQRVLSGAASSHHHLNHRAAWPGFVRGVALCESVLCRGVPVLWAWCNRVLDLTEGVRLPADLAFRDYYMAYGVRPSQGGRSPPPDPGTRESFESAFGLGVDAQLAFEDMLSSMSGFPTTAVESEVFWSGGACGLPSGLWAQWADGVDLYGGLWSVR